LRAPVATVQIIASKEVETAALKAFEAAAAYCQEVRKAGKWVNSFDFLERWVALTESANEEVAG
jgi:hypothetical protein